MHVVHCKKQLLAMDNVHVRLNFNRQPMKPRLGDFVTQVLGDDVEKEVAKLMVKVI
jgi:hypothetical protein